MVFLRIEFLSIKICMLFYIFNRRKDLSSMQKTDISKGSNYKFNQIFGYKGPTQKVVEDDIITAIKFDNDGKYVALGDKAGRVIVFQNNEHGKKNDSSYDYYTEFQSHTRQFDPLRSMEVEEEIIEIDWLKNQGKYLKMITTNSRSIKIWKIFEKTTKTVKKSCGKELNMPKLQNIDSSFVAQSQKQFPCKHLTPIQGFSASLNQQYLLSCDETSVFLWSIQNPNKPYAVCDLMPQNGKIQDIKETITCCKMHPASDSLFLYGMNKGTVRLGDLRVSSNVESNALTFKTELQQKNYLYEMISNVSSVAYTTNGKYIISRDYLTVKIWDIANTKKPLQCVVLQQNMKSKLCDMVENQSIFDKFKVTISPDNNTILTGSYNNMFHMIDMDGSNTQYELNYKKSTISKSMGKPMSPLGRVDYQHKVLASDFNKKKNMVAVASLNCFYTYKM